MMIRDMHRVVIGAIGTPASSPPLHKFGGVPTGLGLEDMPVCPSCEGRFHLYLQIDLSDPRIVCPDVGLPFLWILSCESCCAQGGNWDPMYFTFRRVGERVRIEFLEMDDMGFPHSPLPPRPERPVSLEPCANTRDAATGDRIHRIGGQMDDDVSRPSCVACGRPMAFVGQIATERKVLKPWDHPANVAIFSCDHYTLFAFFCPHCNVLATCAQP